MTFNVENKELIVGSIQITGVASSSVFLIGDTQVITCSSITDTPPEAVGPVVPLTAES